MPYDEKTVMANIAKQGSPVIKAHLEHLAGHRLIAFYDPAIEYLIENDIPIPDHTAPERRRSSATPSGTHPVAGRMGEGVCQPQAPHQPATCPVSATRSISRGNRSGVPRQPGVMTTGSELRQWPVQLALLNPAAPCFDNADLLVSADCVPFAYSGFHTGFLQGRILIIFCPKLDSDIEGYVGKLAAIFTRHTIKSLTLLHMEVPCCGGVRYVVDKALAKAGVTIPVDEKTVTIEGNVE